jgi:hypothetical protein
MNSDSSLKQLLIEEDSSKHASTVLTASATPKSLDISSTTAGGGSHLKDYNFLFTELTPLVSGVYHTPKRIENEDIAAYVTQSTHAEPTIALLT